MPKLFVSHYWTPEERLNVIGYIAARWGDNVDLADRRDLYEAMKVVRMVARLNNETMELNRDMILNFTEEISEKGKS